MNKSKWQRKRGQDPVAHWDPSWYDPGDKKLMPVDVVSKNSLSSLVIKHKAWGDYIKMFVTDLHITESNMLHFKPRVALVCTY